MQQQLEESGLTKNESIIYLFLLKNGSTTTGAIIKQTKLANSRVYESLNTLINKGLVTYNIQKDGKHFQASEPTKLMEIQEEKKQKIAQLLPQLMKIHPLETEETVSAMYEGFEGFKTAFKSIIDRCPKNGTIYIMGFSQQEYSNQSLRIFINNMNTKSAEKKQQLKILLDQSTKKTLGADRAKEKFTQIRYMPQGYISPAAIDIFEDYVYIFLWEEKPFVFMIKNSKIAKSFKTYFQFLWAIAKQ